ncbi:MAG: hypothetical protein PHH59_06825 [Methylovulum sp.]|uniref:hypothetical protein n=1 Tax=Methylovulum sp. TaxID=1916980 RepID=UPI0026338DC7|nr:hypothetical protein [Methylovulum sp.]MDD2723720.1 hypothetical protein [Methylovulum sp.]MDD5123306.1 hypothetical protein [Methylovulum sp.]
MKILCFVIVLANLVLFLWEYRSGAFVQTETVMEGEPILLVGEEKKGLRGNSE